MTCVPRAAWGPLQQRHMLRRHQSVYPGHVYLFFIPIMHGARFHTNQVHLQMSCLCRGLSDRRGESRERCLLMRALKLMCPFSSSKGDLKKSEPLSKRPSHCPAVDQSQSSTQKAPPHFNCRVLVGLQFWLCAKQVTHFVGCFLFLLE